STAPRSGPAPQPLRASRLGGPKSWSCVSRLPLCGAERLHVGGGGQLAQSLCLQLAHSLASESDDAADLLEVARVVAVEAEPQLEDQALALAQAGQPL